MPAPRQPIIEAMMKIHQYAMLCAPITSQAAAIEALENGAGPMARDARELPASAADYFVRRLNEIGLDCHTPGGAFYVFPDVRKFGLSSKDFAMGLLEAEDVAGAGRCLRPTGEGFLRCCYATDVDLIREALERIGRYVSSLPSFAEVRGTAAV